MKLYTYTKLLTKTIYNDDFNNSPLSARYGLLDSSLTHCWPVTVSWITFHSLHYILQHVLLLHIGDDLFLLSLRLSFSNSETPSSIFLLRKHLFAMRMCKIRPFSVSNCNAMDIFSVYSDFYFIIFYISIFLIFLICNEHFSYLLNE